MNLNRRKLLAITFSLTVGQALYVFLPALLGLLIDGISVKNTWNISWLFLFPMLWSLSHIFIAISRFYTSSITQDVRKLSKQFIFKYLIGLSNSVYTDKGAGEVESLMQEVSFNSRYIFSESFPFFIRIFVSITVSILILCSNSLWLGLLFTIWLLLYVPISYIFAKKGINHVSIWQVLEKAQFIDYVKKLPKGLDTIIGVKGSKLSGGERARLAIARALLKNSKIIILDEATAALDSESESLLQKGLEELMVDRTVIAIAHRLSTLRSMDRILIFEKGQIMADGLHESLLQTNDLYKKLWNIQILV